jgi:diamine N-acetyltransferase
MQMLKGKHIYLRALEPEDIDFLFTTENDTSFWEISNTQAPFSRFLLEQYITNSHQDIYEAKQFRFVICNNEDRPVGMIDLFDFEPQHLRVGVGLLLITEQQGKGYGKEALKIIINYAFTYLKVHQIYANITSENEISIGLFEKFNFKKTGVKKDWVNSNSGFKDELLYQLIKE